MKNRRMENKLRIKKIKLGACGLGPKAAPFAVR
jgi:hypothetical protein